jgi:hypothetical protein
VIFQDLTLVAVFIEIAAILGGETITGIIGLKNCS